MIDAFPPLRGASGHKTKVRTCTKRRMTYPVPSQSMGRFAYGSRHRVLLFTSLVVAVSLLLVLSSLSPRGVFLVPRHDPTVSVQSQSRSNPNGADCPELTAGDSSGASHLTLSENSCQLNATISLSQNGTNASSPTTYNLTISIDGLAEVTPGGAIVRYSNLLGSYDVRFFANLTGDMLRPYLDSKSNVTNATGQWSPSAIVGGGISQSGAAVGVVVAQLEFQLQVSPANVSSLKFGVDIDGWPWSNPADHLGLVVGALAEPSAHFTWNSETQNLTEESNGGGGPFVGLQLGGSAIATSPNGQQAPLNVSSYAGLYSVVTSSRPE